MPTLDVENVSKPNVNAICLDASARHAAQSPNASASGFVKQRYRPDIDGLRCLAVLAVVIFHMLEGRLPGGFVGVDVFFVISGYLITGILARDIAAGKFSLGAFYERRLRRIVPALALMIAFSSLCAALVVLPAGLVNYAQSMLAATFSFSNIFFWHGAGYFVPTYNQFLLHTWSLSIEEQFYLIYPCLLFVLTRYSKRFLLPVLIVLSLAASWWLTRTNLEAGFYSPLSRAWELLLGGLLALYPIQLQRLWRNAASGLGLLMMVAPMFLYSRQTVFPGLAALIPCIGCGLILAAGEAGSSGVSRLLSARPLVGLGLISYSVYLWHWPVLLLAETDYFSFLPSHGGEKLGLLALSILLGYLSWKFVEQPFRGKGGLKISRKMVFGGSFAIAVLFTAGAVLVIEANGFPGRFAKPALQVGSVMDAEQTPFEVSCVTAHRSSLKTEVVDSCADDPARKNYLLIGDSHAAALRIGLLQSLNEVNLLTITSPSCNPIVGRYDDSPCGAIREYVYGAFFSKHKIDKVILTHRWMSPHEVEGLGPTSAWLAQRHIPLLVVGPVQEYTAPLPLLLAYSIQKKRPELAKSNMDPRYAQIDTILAGRARTWQVPYLSVRALICPAGKCLDYIGPPSLLQPALSDTNHLSPAAAQWLCAIWSKEGLLQ